MGNQSIINKRLHWIANVNQKEEKGEAKLKKREEDEGKSRSGRWEKGESDNLHLKVFSTTLKFPFVLSKQITEITEISGSGLPAGWHSTVKLHGRWACNISRI